MFIGENVDSYKKAPKYHHAVVTTVMYYAGIYPSRCRCERKVIIEYLKGFLNVSTHENYLWYPVSLILKLSSMCQLLRAIYIRIRLGWKTQAFLEELGSVAEYKRFNWDNFSLDIIFW